MAMKASYILQLGCLRYVETRKIAKHLAENRIIAFINANTEFFYPPYDSCIGTLNSILGLLARYNKRKDMRVLVQQLVFRLVRAYRENGWYPISTDSFEDAVYMIFGQRTEEYQTSGLWGVLLEWFADIMIIYHGFVSTRILS